MPVRYVPGDATAPLGAGKKFLIHVCNDAGGWGKGFVLAVSKRWPEPEKAYRRAARRMGGLPLGNNIVVPVSPDLTVVNMIAQEGYRGPGPHIRYPALRDCLGGVAFMARDEGASVHAPRIGCGLAGGSWDVIGPMLEETLTGLDVFVYDLPEKKKGKR